MLPSGGVRVKLDLSDFVLDVGARRWILLTPGKMVRDSPFNLPRSMCFYMSI